ncbi:class I SAM-dependent methyltransferase [Paenibacillus camelliae]|uniref:class I SAM-dependent methyltransferase n=1 Tax=Paenibacillus camelliae TaxID=512410 RepID=UPI00203D7BC0|nr:class I SAM-dependent methyltransferase [Paenibacillus camelliae]MCM3631894.1 methyltransferase domain-containing protein [Paenibacillus camelliae]
MNSTNAWHSDHYDNKLNFVSELGKGVVELLDPKKDERILDLGCGTGELADQISQSGAIVTGIDLSESMINSAKQKYPHIPFFIENGENFQLREQVDAVFSNAALHWMTSPSKVITCVRNALKGGGRFVAEFGGKGNVERVIQSLTGILHDEYGIDASLLNPWYFPSIGEYSTLLEQLGFRVVYATHFDRPTEMTDGEAGLQHWLKGFAGNFFSTLTDTEKENVLFKMAAQLRDELYINGSWYIDYKRIRIMAIKDSL